MNEQPISFIAYVILTRHGAHAELLGRELVVAPFFGGASCDGEVLIFALEDHPTASLCYAWEMDGLVTSVLHEPPIRSASDAVSAALVRA